VYRFAAHHRHTMVQDRPYGCAGWGVYLTQIQGTDKGPC
jgi:hypothetical protein